MMNDIDAASRLRIVKDIDQNFLVEASAGSGKTTMLVERMVAMIESGIPVNLITTITFTKKAANEFYERFYKRLYERSRPDYKKKQFDLLEVPNEQARINDLKALKDIDLCFMGTIDSFCNAVLKERPFEANVPSSATIVQNKDDLIPAINSVLDDIRSGSDGLSERLKLMEVLHKRDNLYILIFHALDKREFEFNFEDSNTQHFAELTKDFDAQLEKFKGLIKFIKSLDPTKHFKSNVSNSIYAYCKNNYERIMRIKATDYKGIYELKSSHIKSFSFNQTIPLSSIPNDALDFIAPAVNSRSTNKIDADKYNAVFDKFDYFVYVKTLEFLSLLRSLLLDALKKKGLLQFSDNLMYLNNLLKDKSKGPSAIKSIRRQHHYYLIDEFQDTSPLQVELFFRLSSDTYKENYEEIIPNKGSLFMVGDPKQSIYRFRGADFVSYSNVKNKLLNNPNIGEVLKLTRNFRSNLSLCTYFNTKFHKQSYLKDIKNVQTACDEIPIDNKVDGSGLAGLYKYSFTEDANDFAYVANMIKRIKDENPDLNYHDFMIIPSSKAHVGAYKKALADLSISSFAEGSVIFSNDLVVSTLRLFEYIARQDKLSMYAVLTSPLFNICLSNFELNIDKEEYISSLLKIDIKAMRQMLPSLLLEKLITNEYILSKSGLDGLDSLIALFNVVKEEENNGNVNSYIDAVNVINEKLNDKNFERIALLKNDLDAVRIANLHKVKGLESKVVILASNAKRAKQERAVEYIANSDTHLETIFQLEAIGDNFIKTCIIKNSDAKLDAIKEQEAIYLKEEEKRLFYVAATRARNALLINENEYTPWMDLLTDYSVKEYPNTKLDIDTSYMDSLGDINASEIINIPLISDINAKDVNICSYHELSPSQIKSPSFKELDDDTEMIKGKEDATLIGTIVHKLMESIVKAKDMKLTKDKCLEIANEYQCDKYVSLLNGVLETIYSGGYKQTNGYQDDIYSDIKKYKCYSEVPFSYKKDNNIIYGFIDLIIERENDLIIIDYKTDNNINTDHTSQLKAYQDAVKDIINKDSKAYIYNIKV